MTEFNIERYFNSLADNVEKITISYKNNTYIPRDINASKNILLLLQCEKQGKRRPKCFSAAPSV
jgi:hypothetical protein